MNNDKALMIVESAQSPQPVVVSDVSKDEIEYQRAYKECTAIFDQLRVAEVRYTTVLERLLKAWFAENYPGVAYALQIRYEHDESIRFGVEMDLAGIDYSVQQIIDMEIREYLARLCS